ncbi:MAG: DinB family protein [Chloroflexi bacterium]|nr:DinB family protein [Chloroflexota bacterium]
MPREVVADVADRGNVRRIGGAAEPFEEPGGAHAAGKHGDAHRPTSRSERRTPAERATVARAPPPRRLYPAYVPDAQTAFPTAALSERIDALAAARGALLDALDGIEQAQFVRRPDEPDDEHDARWSVREVLWHVADSERCWREWAEAALRGEAVTRFRGVRRPAELNRPRHLLASLDEQRAATLAFLAGLPGDADLAAPRPSPGREMSVLAMLDHLTNHDRDHAEQVAALSALPPREAR